MAQDRLRFHGWLWTIVGSLMLLGVLWQQPRATDAATLAVIGLGVLDVAAGILVLRRTPVGRSLLSLTLTGHLALAAWLWYGAQMLAASLGPSPTPMTHEQMIGHTAGNAMLGMVVLFFEGLAILSVLACGWTTIDLYRFRRHRQRR